MKAIGIADAQGLDGADISPRAITIQTPQETVAIQTPHRAVAGGFSPYALEYTKRAVRGLIIRSRLRFAEMGNGLNYLKDTRKNIGFLDFAPLNLLRNNAGRDAVLGQERKSQSEFETGGSGSR